MPFARPSLRELIARARADIAPLIDTVLGRRSVEDVLARVLAGATHELHGRMAWVHSQSLPDRCNRARLEQWAADLFIDPPYAAAKALAVTVHDTTGDVLVPDGTEATRDDLVRYVSIGSTLVGGGGFNLTAVQWEAVETGPEANGVGTLTIDTAIPNVDSEADIVYPGARGGRDAETTPELRARVLAEFAPRHEDYIALAKEVLGVARVWTTPGPGTVTVYHLRIAPEGDGWLFPTTEEVEELQEHLDEYSSVLVDVTAVAPTAQAVNITLTAEPDGDLDVRAAIEAELQSLFTREAAPGQTMLLTHIDEAVSRAEGETDHDVTAPAADVAASSSAHILVLGTVTWS